MCDAVLILEPLLFVLDIHIGIPTILCRYTADPTAAHATMHLDEYIFLYIYAT